MGETLSEHLPIRLTDSMLAAVHQLAHEDGMSTSAWVRRIVDSEVARRDGKCPTCGTSTVGDFDGQGER